MRGASGGDCGHCGRPLIFVHAGMDRLCLNSKCPPHVLRWRIFWAVLAVAAMAATQVWLDIR